MATVASGSADARAASVGYDVFLSHKSEHKAWVEWLATSLRASGRSVFLDIWNLVPGESWVEGLRRGVDECRAAVLVATPDVINSGWIREEYNALLLRRQATPGFRLVPIVFGDIPNLPFLLNLQGIDCRDSARYRQWFQRLLDGLDGREPGPNPEYSGQLPPPPPMRGAATQRVLPGEQAFVQRIMGRIGRANCPPIMVTARGRRHPGALIKALLECGRSDFGNQQVLHITPPFSAQASTEACFTELGRQCGLAAGVVDANAFTAALGDKLMMAGVRHFLLVTGFENAQPQVRHELAGALRTASEQHLDSLRIVLLGGEKLMEQKYAIGKLSFLSHAEVQEWPDPTPSDALSRQRLHFPGLNLSETAAEELVSAAGGHAGLMRFCLERWEEQGGEPAWSDWCYLCPELWETWYALASVDPDKLRGSLERPTLGSNVPWSPDPTTRRLYWSDLLGVRGTSLVWRADVVKRVGVEVLG